MLIYSKVMSECDVQKYKKDPSKWQKQNVSRLKSSFLHDAGPITMQNLPLLALDCLKKQRNETIGSECRYETVEGESEIRSLNGNVNVAI